MGVEREKGIPQPGEMGRELEEKGYLTGKKGEEAKLKDEGTRRKGGELHVFVSVQGLLVSLYLLTGDNWASVKNDGATYITFFNLAMD